MTDDTQITPEFRKQLKQFCIELNAWIEAGCPEHKIFKIRDGICWNYSNWIHPNDQYSFFPSDTPLRAFLGSTYPFSGGYELFQIEQDSRTLYKNPARLAWIKEHMK